MTGPLTPTEIILIVRLVILPARWRSDSVMAAWR